MTGPYKKWDNFRLYFPPKVSAFFLERGLFPDTWAVFPECGQKQMSLFTFPENCTHMGGTFSRYVGNFPEMWAETYVSAHIPGKLPTYQEKAPPLKRKLPFLGGSEV